MPEKKPGTAGTNFDLHLNSYQSVLEHHQKRGQAENFIREEKYGYDPRFGCPGD